MTVVIFIATTERGAIAAVKTTIAALALSGLVLGAGAATATAQDLPTPDTKHTHDLWLLFENHPEDSRKRLKYFHRTWQIERSLLG